MDTSNTILCATEGSAHSVMQTADTGNTTRTTGIKNIEASLKISCWNNHRIADLEFLIGN